MLGVELLILSFFMTQIVLQFKNNVLLPAFSYLECIYWSITPFWVFLMIFFWCYEGVSSSGSILKSLLMKAYESNSVGCQCPFAQ